MTSKLLTRKELEDLIQQNHESLKFIQKQKTLNSSQLWEYFHQIFVNNIQQQFVTCNGCKSLLVYTSANGTNNMKTHLKSCSTTKVSNLNQKKVHELFSPKKTLKVRRKIRLSVIQACTEFSALDGRPFEVINGNGFKTLAQALLDAGRSLNNSSVQVYNHHQQIVKQYHNN
ncbi:unnamed protein product [Adineta ricciae]|uniref:BED-type domain-containing protein n=1 Tax=Adineta ricciae TaxID=249248 RepID=A0A815WUN5_ADIRI|nr:unnamed protein product [Adineta ricciae]